MGELGNAPELLPMNGSPCVLRARITEEQLDQPIRRIFPLWLLQRSIRLRQLTLVAPGRWEDPHEDPASLCLMQSPRGSVPHKEQGLDVYLARAWAQCWSFNPGSDTLLRAYSRVTLDPIERRNSEPRLEGVTVTTTPRLLMGALKAWSQERQNGHFIIGRVDYAGEEHIRSRIGGILHSIHGPEFFRTIQGRGESLLWKRDYFAHEDEVRVLYLMPDPNRPMDDFQPLPIDPNALFTSLGFDPRLEEFERKEREAEFRRIGYTGEIAPDLSYKKTFTMIPMPRGWPEP